MYHDSHGIFAFSLTFVAVLLLSAFQVMETRLSAPPSSRRNSSTQVDSQVPIGTEKWSHDQYGPPDAPELHGQLRPELPYNAQLHVEEVVIQTDTSFQVNLNFLC